MSTAVEHYEIGAVVITTMAKLSDADVDAAARIAASDPGVTEAIGRACEPVLIDLVHKVNDVLRAFGAIAGGDHEA